MAFSLLAFRMQKAEAACAVYAYPQKRVFNQSDTSRLSECLMPVRRHSGEGFATADANDGSQA